MTRDHRNIARRDLAFEDYDAYLADRLRKFFDRDGISDIDHSWNYVHDARVLYEDGRFGRLLKLIDRQPTRAKWEHMKTADCIRCGEPEVGILGVIRAVETPSGDIKGVDQHSELCPECADRVEHELAEYGRPQPTLARGAWWTQGGERACR